MDRTRWTNSDFAKIVTATSMYGTYGTYGTHVQCPKWNGTHGQYVPAMALACISHYLAMHAFHASCGQIPQVLFANEGKGYFGPRPNHEANNQDQDWKAFQNRTTWYCDTIMIQCHTWHNMFMKTTHTHTQLNLLNPITNNQHVSKNSEQRACATQGLHAMCSAM